MSSIILEARDLLGPSRDRVDVDSEYERALVELTTRVLGLAHEDCEAVRALIVGAE